MVPGEGVSLTLGMVVLDETGPGVVDGPAVVLVLVLLVLLVEELLLVLVVMSGVVVVCGVVDLSSDESSQSEDVSPWLRRLKSHQNFRP